MKIRFGHPQKTPWLVTVWRDGVRLGTITRISGRASQKWTFSAFMNQPRFGSDELESIAAKIRRLNA